MTASGTTSLSLYHWKYGSIAYSFNWAIVKCGQFLKRYLHTGSPLRGKLAVKDEHHPLVAVITVCPRRLPAHNLLNAVCSVHVQCPLKSDTTDSCEHVHSPLQPHPPDSCLPVHCLLSHTQQTAVYMFTAPIQTWQAALYMFTAPCWHTQQTAVYPFTATCTQKPCRHMQQIAVYLFTAPSHTQQTAAYLFSHLYRDSCVPVNCPCRQLCTCLLPPCRQLCTCLLPPCTHTQQTAVYCAHVYCPPADTQQTAVYMFTAPLQTHTTDSCYCAHVYCPHAHTHTHTIDSCLHVSCRHTQ